MGASLLEAINPRQRGGLAVRQLDSLICKFHLLCDVKLDSKRFNTLYHLWFRMNFCQCATNGPEKQLVDSVKSRADLCGKWETTEDGYGFYSMR